MDSRSRKSRELTEKAKKRHKKKKPGQFNQETRCDPAAQKYYQKAEYGYCRGTEPIEYVKQIMIYYDILRHQGIEYRTDSSLLYKFSHQAA